METSSDETVRDASGIMSQPTRNQPGDLCEYCKELATYDGLMQIQKKCIFKHDTVPAVFRKAQADRPCPLCKLIATGMTSPNCREQHSVVLRVPTLAGRRPPEYIWRNVGVGADCGGSGQSCDGWASRQLFLVTSDGKYLFIGAFCSVFGWRLAWLTKPTTDDPSQGVSDCKKPLSTAKGDRLFSEIRIRLEACERDHPRCAEPFLPFLPGRVIDVSPGVPGVDARLVVTAEGQRARYICLSYCWGGPQKITTTRASLPFLSGSIPVHETGVTIQDAIETTRNLGIRYLWIDALCIVQDDEESIQADVSNMACIYSNATVVIAAVNTSSSNQGFMYHNRSMDASWHQVLTGYRFPISLPSGLVANLELNFETRVEPNQEPLHARAWAVQETVLARRRIIFTTYEVFFECHSSSVELLRSSCLSYGSLLASSSHLRWAKAGTSFPPLSNWSEEFNQLLRRYTECRLTYPGDRLRAFQGISDTLGARCGSRFNFGILTSWPAMLTWRVQLLTLSRSPRAPGWSWGCLDDGVISHIVIQSGGDTDCGEGYSVPRHGADWEEGYSTSRLADDTDPWKLIVSGSIIHGKDWKEDHPPVFPVFEKSVVEYGRARRFQDVYHGYIAIDSYSVFSNPWNRTYLRLYGGKETDVALVLQRVDSGSTYRRAGIYWGPVFNKAWEAKQWEVALV